MSAFNQGRRDAGVSFNAYVSRDSEINLERQYVHEGSLAQPERYYFCTFSGLNKI